MMGSCFRSKTVAVGGFSQEAVSTKKAFSESSKRQPAGRQYMITASPTSSLFETSSGTEDQSDGTSAFGAFPLAYLPSLP